MLELVEGLPKLFVGKSESGALKLFLTVTHQSVDLSNLLRKEFRCSALLHLLVDGQCLLSRRRCEPFGLFTLRERGKREELFVRVRKGGFCVSPLSCSKTAFSSLIHLHGGRILRLSNMLPIHLFNRMLALSRALLRKVRATLSLFYFVCFCSLSLVPFSFFLHLCLHVSSVPISLFSLFVVA